MELESRRWFFLFAITENFQEEPDFPYENPPTLKSVIEFYSKE